MVSAMMSYNFIYNTISLKSHCDDFYFKALFNAVKICGYMALEFNVYT